MIKIKSFARDRIYTSLAGLTRIFPPIQRHLALPPSGSNLKPVPGDGGLPLVGHSLEAYDNLLALHRRQYDRYGPVFWTSLATKQVVMAVGPDAVGEVLLNKDKAFASAGWEPFLVPFFRRGILLLDFDEHKFHRRIMQQAFARPRLVGYLDTMNRAINGALNTWQPRDNFNMYPAIKQLTLDIANQVFVGEPLGPEATKLHRAFTASVEATLAVVRYDVPGSRWRAGLRGRQTLEKLFREKLSAKRMAPGTDLFSVLCTVRDESGAAFSDEDVINHMIFLMMAAHDTTTTTVSMMLYYLATHPQWQQRLRDESVLLGKQSIDYDDMERLPALDLVFKETMRLCTPVGALARLTVRDTELLGHFVPQGTLVGAAVSSSHRMQPWWDNPDAFDPTRFSDDRREDKNQKMKFTPFGGGAHQCIGLHFGGMEAKAILHKMLLRYEWFVPAGYTPKMGYLTGPYPADGLPINLHRRDFSQPASARHSRHADSSLHINEANQ